MDETSPITVDGRPIYLGAADTWLDPEFVLKSCYARPGDIVVISGTLIEGIGNAYSDIDVYVITDSYRQSGEIALQHHHRVLTVDRDIVRPDTPSSPVLLIHTVIPGTSIKIDVEFKPFAEVESLLARIHDIYEYASDNLILLTKRLTDREEIMVHRLLNCVPILGQERFTALLRRLPVDEYRYIAYRWVASDFAILLDLAGAWDAGELDRAVELARENVFVQTSGYLRLRGVTNLRRKWLLTYLKRLPDAACLLERFIDLVYLRGTETPAGKAIYVARALDYVDDLFTLSCPLLEAIPRVPSGERGVAVLRRERDDSEFNSDYAQWEYEYRMKAYGHPGLPTRQRLRGLDAAVGPRR